MGGVIPYKFIGYAEMKELLGLPMVMTRAKDVMIDDEMTSKRRDWRGSCRIEYGLRIKEIFAIINLNNRTFRQF